MHPIELITLILSAITLIVSGLALIISVKNRRNGMREHLYKEQMTYFLLLSKELHLMLELFYNIKDEGMLTKSNDQKLEHFFDKIDELTESFEFITPEKYQAD